MDSSQINDFQQEPIRKVSILLGIGIFIMPYIFSWFTLRKGYSNLARIISFSWLIILFALPLISPKSENSSNSQIEKEAESTKVENLSISDTTDSKIDINSGELISIDPDIPKLKDFYDLNSRDIEHSLVYWFIMNANDDRFTRDNLLSVFVPEIFDTHSPFEKERIEKKFNESLPELTEYLNSYKGIKYISIPISFKEPSDEWLVYATREVYENTDNIYYDVERKIFKNFCPNKFYAMGPPRGRIRGANVREQYSQSFDNRTMALIYKSIESDKESLCFLAIEDEAKAETVYNALSSNKLLIKGRAYLKISSILDPENKSVSILGNEDTANVVAEIMAIDLYIYSTAENIKNPDLIYHKIIPAPSFYK